MGRTKRTYVKICKREFAKRCDLRSAAALRYRQIHLSPDQIRRVLKKKGEFGSVPELATNSHHNPTEKLIKQADLQLLEIAQALMLKQLTELQRQGAKLI